MLPLNKIMKSMCCLCVQFTHENTSERTILHLVKKNILGLVACTAKKASYTLENDINVRDVIDKIYQVGVPGENHRPAASR
jgi:hypothetical protein